MANRASALAAHVNGPQDDELYAHRVLKEARRGLDSLEELVHAVADFLEWSFVVTNQCVM